MLVLMLVLMPWVATAGSDSLRSEGLIELEDIYSPDSERRVDFSASVPRVQWLDEDTWLERRKGDDGKHRYLRVTARTGESEPFFDHEKFRQAMMAVAGVSEDDADAAAYGRLRFDSERTAGLFHHGEDLFAYRLGEERVTRLTHDPTREVGEEWSPDGRMVSFVRGHDLYLYDLESGRERRLTNDGSEELLYGRLDWVYQEELYGRGNFKGYWWSPDSRSLALLRLDESDVLEFTVVDHLPLQQDVEITNYPKAGAPNPKVSLGVIPASGGEIRWVDTSTYAPIEHLIVRVGWKPDSSRIVFQVQDREQRWLDLNLADPTTGKIERVLREESEAFVEVIGDPKWLENGDFLWQSARTGFTHFYRYVDGKAPGTPLTEGEWDVRGLEAVDEQGGFVYFTASKDSPIGPQLYRVALDGGKVERLTERDGSHSPELNTDFTLIYDAWSNLETPTQARVHSLDGSEVRLVEENRIDELGRYELGTVERHQVKARDGFVMEAVLIKPPDFDPNKKYPVLQYNYGGPHAPVVRDAWGGQRYLWHHYLAQRGYVIWLCDNRSASGKGVKGIWEAYGRLGEVELRDIEDGLDWLIKKPWVDSERIGIWGWSYGGFMASYALTHSDRFKMGIAGAPVTDWRLYDSVYTERYMRMPQNNESGYDATSVVKAAADLSGELLVIHGSIDDNVHLQNTMRLIYALQKAGKSFEMMIYPKARHGVRDREQQYHLQQLMTDFIMRKL